MTSITSPTDTAPIAGEPCPIDGKRHKSGTAALDKCIVTFRSRIAAAEFVARVAADNAQNAPATDTEHTSTETTVPEIAATDTAPATKTSKASKTSKATKGKSSKATKSATEHTHIWSRANDAATGEPIDDMECIVAECGETRAATDTELATFATEHTSADTAPAKSSKAKSSKASKRALLGSAPGTVPAPKASKSSKASKDTTALTAKPDMSWVPTSHAVTSSDVDTIMKRVAERQSSYVEDAVQLRVDMFRMFVSGAWQDIKATTDTGNVSSKAKYDTWRAFCDSGMRVRQVFGVARSNADVKYLRDTLIRALYTLTDDSGAYLATVDEVGQAVGLGYSTLDARRKALGLSRYDTEDTSTDNAPATKPAKYSADDLRSMSPDELIALIGGDQWATLASMANEAHAQLPATDTEHTSTDTKPATEHTSTDTAPAKTSKATKPATGAGDTMREAMAGALASKASKAATKPAGRRAGSKASKRATLTDAEVNTALAMAG